MEGYPSWFENLSDGMTDAITDAWKQLCLGDEACSTLTATITWLELPDGAEVEAIIGVNCGREEECGLSCYNSEELAEVALKAVVSSAEDAMDWLEGRETD